MRLSRDSDKYRRQWRAGGGWGGDRPVRPRLRGEWRPGMACHWMEVTRFAQWKFYIVRVLMILQLAAGVLYLWYRGSETVGRYDRSKQAPYLAYQIFFFVLETISVISIVFRFFEAWKVTRRNCIDFKQLPNDLIAPRFTHSPRSRVRPQHSNYPSVGIFIPCYNEDVDLVLETVLGAVNIDYPRELLTVYLCDDGKDPLKRSMISQLRRQYRNIHYVIRPEHNHAKAGNLNYSLERTTTDLVVTLDADFVPRPNIIQRLMPYYFVYNAEIGKYEFNETLAVVQTPQHFRNLSPYDSDPLDQRSSFFFELVLPGKDWFNASTMIGTNNMLSRTALEEAGYYPYHSITEDTAMSLCFHGLGYRTYFVNESLATGLATTSLWSNLGQRARWLKGDWQILFSKKGPVTAKGLNLVQRILYLHMTFSRLISVVHLMYDIGAILLLVGGITPLDTPDPIRFIIFISIYLFAGVVMRFILNAGGQALDKSESGAVAFEAIFRYITVKGLFIALFQGQNVKFKVTDKKSTMSKQKAKENPENPDVKETPEKFQQNPRMTVLGRPSPGKPAQGMETEAYVMPEIEPPPAVHTVGNHSPSSISQEDASSLSASDDDDGRTYKKNKTRARSPEERAERRKDTFRNLKRIWFNILMAILLIFAITWGIVNPPLEKSVQTTVLDGVRGTYEFQNVLPLAMALGFALMNLLPHLLAIYLCFIPYVSGWMMTDLVHGRCDQYAVHPKTGKLFVPWSFISLLSIAKIILMVGSVGALAYFTFGGSKPVFVPLTSQR